MPNNLRLLVKRFLLILVYYSLCRLLFFTSNFSYFSGAGFLSIIWCFISGTRFDVTAIIITNILFLILHVNPFSFFYKRWYQVILTVLFIGVNAACILSNCIDFALFRFTGRRATIDAFHIMGFGDDFLNTVPSIIRDFWYLILLFVFLSVSLLWNYSKIKVVPVTVKKPLLIQISSYVVLFALTFIGFRGGVQYRPINIMNASQYGSPKLVALILNTPFTLIKTMGKNELTNTPYFSDDEAKSISPVIHQYAHRQGFKKQNVVILILESFGKEYIGSLNSYQGYTPFLDSLMKESLVFENAFANSKRSMEGIPAIVSGIPSLMNEPFITSAYNGDEITGLAHVLKRKGYASAFYHGGTNGTMGFDNFSRVAGYDRYLGRREYNNDKDFDGNWGIYDEPFLQFTANDLNKTAKPFLATVFTVSSHHPYAIPSRYSNQFTKGTLPIHKSVQYADYSLKRFFEAASKMPWFSNTLFVITADHTALSEYPKYQSKVGIYSIPVVFYKPDGSLKGKSSVTTEQIDIMPSILDYLGYSEKFFAFGNSVFDSTASHFSANFINDSYQIISDEYALTMDATHLLSLYNYPTDSLLQNNLINRDTLVQKNLERKLKAFVQNYKEALIENRMVAK